jgi:hypothetical protein
MRTAASTPAMTWTVAKRIYVQGLETDLAQPGMGGVFCEDELNGLPALTDVRLVLA